MNDDRYFDGLREAARELRYEPDAASLTRMRARIADRVRSRPATISELLAGWFRPLAASLVALALAATTGLVWIEQSQNNTSLESISASATETALTSGDFLSADR